MIYIDGIAVEDDVVNSLFRCDLAKCKGACCTFPGDFGAPLLDSEVEQIEQSMAEAAKYLSDRSKSVLKYSGFYEGSEGSLTTMCIDRRDCVFVFYEGDIAKCALEAAYFAGKTEFRKPISCHLFPVRVREYSSLTLHYERISECLPGVKKGESESILLIDTIRDALVRAFGAEWAEKLKANSKNLHEMK